MTGLRLFLRTFTLQASWNARDLLGAGAAWVLLPWRSGETPDDRVRSIPFNAHPYLAGMALAALLRLEREGVESALRRRFLDAVRSPLGSLGDALIWAGWLPTCLLLAGICLLLGFPPLAAAILFLLLFNTLHLSLRYWAVRTGLREGLAVGEGLRRAGLASWAERSRGAGVFLGGVFLGLLAVRAITGSASAEPGGLFWLVPGVVLFLAGVRWGRETAPAMPGILALLLLGSAFLFLSLSFAP